VLVHCYAGISRSSSTVMSYLMKKYNLSLKTAFEHVRSCRWFVNPNPGFCRQLKQFEKELDHNRGGPGQATRDALPFTY
jgi:protein-tyrosine phosphatase